MKPKFVRTVAGLALAPLGLEVVPHQLEAECATAADVTIRLCSSEPRFLMLPSREHVPNSDHETRTARPVQWLASGVSSITAQRPVVALAGESVNWYFRD